MEKKKPYFERLQKHKKLTTTLAPPPILCFHFSIDINIINIQ